MAPCNTLHHARDDVALPDPEDARHFNWTFQPSVDPTFDQDTGQRALHRRQRRVLLWGPPAVDKTLLAVVPGMRQIAPSVGAAETLAATRSRKRSSDRPKPLSCLATAHGRG